MRLLLANLTFGLRMLFKSPGFTVTTIATLAIGIGANTALFTVTNALLLRPFPYRNPGELVTVTARDKAKDFGGTLMRYELLRDQGRSFASVAVWANDNLNLSGNGEEALQVPVARISPSFFSTLGVHPALGRIFTEDEGRPDGKLVVMLSDALWRSRYHADPNIVGRAVTLDSVAQTIVGVLPANAQFPFVGQADIYTPRYFELSLMTPQRLRMGVGYLNILARLRTGTSLAQANTELAVLNRRYNQLYPAAPDAGPETETVAAPLRELVVADVRGKVFLLFSSVALVLLIACANVASLMLSRALTRRKEFAVRTALGASRGMIIRQLLSEALLLAIAASIAGVALSWFAIRALVTWGAAEIPQGIPIALDPSVLLFTLGLSLIAGILFGLFPALELSRTAPHTTLRDEGRAASMSRTRARTQSVLVVSQIALSLVLLIAAGLLLRSFARLLRVDPGFEPHNLLTMNVSLSTTKYAKPDQQTAFFYDVLRRVSALPGVRQAAVSATLPLTFKRVTPMLPDGQPDVPLAERPFLDIEAISPAWFQTVRVPLRSGRQFTSADDAKAPKVVIVNETFARRFWPSQSAVGHHVFIGRWTEAAQVIGVAADIKNQGLARESQAQIYIPFPQLPWSDMNLLVRTDLPPQAISRSIRAEIDAIDRAQPLTEVHTADELMAGERTQSRFTMVLVALFAFTAMALALIGIYGVLAYSVAERRQEIGIRLALGAERSHILRLVLRQGLLLAVAGIAAGLILSLLFTQLLARMLYQVNTRDLATFLIAPWFLLLIALLASYLPAHRAMQVDPIESLR
jgi:putative ABC transport system permease protein